MKDVPETLLREITQRLVAELQPEMIIQFGSHVWGQPDTDSDLDLLVIVADSNERPVQRSRRAHRCLRGLGVPKDIIVKTKAETERSRRIPTSLTNRVITQGRVLYG